jgi:hypothetical protein
MTNTTYQTQDEAWEAGNEWINNSDKWEKLEFLQETCTTDFVEKELLHYVVKFMGQDDFNEFFNHLRRNWGINTPQELEYEMNQ